jgi:DNA-directed RNA polymerase subunit RPC12/RpoP
MDPATTTSRSHEEREALAGAARESMRRQTLDLLEKRHLLDSDELEACPRCGERLIVVSQQATWIRDRASRERICAPCGTELALLDLMGPSHDIGGEG